MKLAHILHNSFKNDSRVLKELQSLNSFKQIHSINLFCVQGDGLPNQENIYDKIQITRIEKPKFDSKRFIFLKGMGFIIWTYKVLKELKKLNPDILHCHDLTGLLVGFFYKLLIKKCYLIYDSHEFQTEVKNSTGLRKLIFKLMETTFIRSVDKFITVSGAIAENYKYRYGINQPILILNCPRAYEPKSSKLLKEKFHLKDSDMLFLYQGGLSPGRGIELILNAFNKLSGSSSHIAFMGYGPLEDAIKESAKKNPNVHFIPAVSMDVLLDYTSSADVGICLTDTSCLNHLYCLPNKFFEYINAGIPVITTNLYELSKILKKYQIGVTIKSETSDDLIDAITRIISEKEFINRDNVKKASKIFNWEVQEKKLINLYSEIVNKI